MNEFSPDCAPWWRHGHVWLVVSGPAVVVVASLITGWIALSGADALVAEDYYRQGMNINKTLQEGDKALLPALQARNHAATPASPPPKH